VIAYETGLNARSARGIQGIGKNIDLAAQWNNPEQT